MTNRVTLAGQYVLQKFTLLVFGMRRRPRTLIHKSWLLLGSVYPPKMRMRAASAAGLLVVGLAACGGTSEDQKFVNLAVGRDSSGDLNVYVAQDKEAELVNMGYNINASQ